ncbi:hypothetical protein WNY63_19395 [Pseudoalteromonas neustonica]|uniref:Uncharacterized protein n=1 Tax=Pseudoalteromonas neustonica TaxID=1840331 RepID=A0ABU9U787_9GAMM
MSHFVFWKFIKFCDEHLFTVCTFVFAKKISITFDDVPFAGEVIETHLRKNEYEIGYVTIDNFDWYINAKRLKAKELDL